MIHIWLASRINSLDRQHSGLKRKVYINLNLRRRDPRYQSEWDTGIDTVS